MLCKFHITTEDTEAHRVFKIKMIPLCDPVTSVVKKMIFL